MASIIKVSLVVLKRKINTENIYKLLFKIAL